LEATAVADVKLNRASSALTHLHEMKAVAAKAGLRPELARAALLEGEALLQCRRPKEARRVLEDGIALAREMGLVPLLSHQLYWLSQAQEAVSDRVSAAQSIFEAAAIVRELASGIADEATRRSFLEVPLQIAITERAERLERAGFRPCGMPGAPPLSPEQIAAGAYQRARERLGPSAPLRDLLTALLDESIDAIQAQRGLLILMDASTVEVTIARNLEGETITDVADYCGSILRDASAGDAILAVDAAHDERFRERRSVVLHHIQSLMCAPLRVNDRVPGALYFDSRAGSRLFREEDLAVVRAFAATVSTCIGEAREAQRRHETMLTLNRDLAQRYRLDNLVGESPPMRRLFSMMEAVIRADCNVLVSGESGTGKELVARAIHFAGSRKLRNFVPLDCGAIPETLVESELFGYRKGAFSGADSDKSGLLEEADGGTLFLDEITNTSLAFQAKLLRALQSGEFRRLGDTAPRVVDVRIIAATNADIDDAIRAGRFREDLYYRLNVVSLALPPLRERPEDIPILAEHFARKYCAAMGLPFLGIGRGALARLASHPWPGNVRELEHAIESALVLSGDGMVRRESLPERVLGGELEEVRDLLREEAALAGSSSGSLEDERARIEEALNASGGDKSRAARSLGWNRMRLYRRMKSLGIPIDSRKIPS